MCISWTIKCLTPLLHFIFRVFYIYLSAFRVILFYSFQLRLSESSVFTASWIRSTLLQGIHTPNAKICRGVMQNLQRSYYGMQTYDTKYEIQSAFLGPLEWRTACDSFKTVLYRKIQTATPSAWSANLLELTMRTKFSVGGNEWRNITNYFRCQRVKELSWFKKSGPILKEKLSSCDVCNQGLTAVSVYAMVYGKQVQFQLYVTSTLERAWSASRLDHFYPW